MKKVLKTKVGAIAMTIVMAILTVALIALTIWLFIDYSLPLIQYVLTHTHWESMKNITPHQEFIALIPVATLIGFVASGTLTLYFLIVALETKK